MSATYRILAGFCSSVCALPYSHGNLDRTHDAGRAKRALRPRARYHGGMLTAVQSLRRHPFTALAALAKTSSPAWRRVEQRRRLSLTWVLRLCADARNCDNLKVRYRPAYANERIDFEYLITLVP
jgi:hypothetical protein